MSLLLDALKKAALEKQRREQSAQGEADASTAEKAPEPSVEPIAASAVENKKVEVAEAPVLVENVPVHVESAPVLVEKTPLAVEEAPLEFDLAAIDDNYRLVMEGEQHTELSFALQEETVPPEKMVTESVAEQQELVIDEVLIEKSLAEAKAQADALKPPVPAAPKIPSVKKTPQQFASVEKTETAEPVQTAAPVQAAEPMVVVAQPIATNQIAHFNAHSGKDALNQLLSRSSQAAKNARKRMISIYAILTLTSVTLVGMYYYLLSSGSISSSLSSELSADVIPAGGEPLSMEEAAPEATQPDVINEATPLTEEMVDAEGSPLIDDADTYTPPDADENVNAASVAGEKNILATKPTKPAQQKATAPAAEKKSPAQTTQARPAENIAERSVSLPAEQRPAQAIISRQAAVDDISESISRGYQAYQAGDFSAAELAYREALAEDPHQRDALLGAAAVAVQLNRQEEALRFYQQRLARAPKDEYAQAGILALTTSSDNNPQFDSELNRLLREFPNAAHLHFLKGSLYAARQQWAAAQLAFFEAWQRDNKNPNYAFNLAVAMDHIQEPKEAMRFYQQALLLSGDRQVGFSTDAVQQRVQELEQQ